ncbi:MAG: hypothetical protein Q4D54_04115 [Eubacteriales bacterium]|nr:hypothetical protein [Eubacteriales bacterium]
MCICPFVANAIHHMFTKNTLHNNRKIGMVVACKKMLTIESIYEKAGKENIIWKK